MLTLLAYDHVINHLEITEIIFLAIKPELAVKKESTQEYTHTWFLLYVFWVQLSYQDDDEGEDETSEEEEEEEEELTGRKSSPRSGSPTPRNSPKAVSRGIGIVLFSGIYVLYIVYHIFFTNIVWLQERKHFFPYIICFARNYSGIRKYFPSGLEVLPAGSTSSTLRGPLPPPSAHSTLTRLQVLLYVQEVLTHFSKLLLRLVRTSLTYST